MTRMTLLSHEDQDTPCITAQRDTTSFPFSVVRICTCPETLLTKVSGLYIESP